MDRLKNTLNIYSKITRFHPEPITHSPKRFAEISLLLRFHVKHAYRRLILTLTGNFLHLQSILVPGFVIGVIEITADLPHSCTIDSTTAPPNKRIRSASHGGTFP